MSAITAAVRRRGRRRSARCSSDCGFHPSSAATTNSTSRTGPTPASMLRMNRSWPGTSTNPISRPEGSVHHAYPRSIVSPRRFSSSSDRGPCRSAGGSATTCRGRRGRPSRRRGGRSPSRAPCRRRLSPRRRRRRPRGRTGSARREVRAAARRATPSARRAARRVSLDPTEHRRAPGAQPGRERGRGPRTRTATPHDGMPCPGIEPRRPPTRSRDTCAPSSSPSSASREPVRAALDVVGGSRSIVHTGSSCARPWRVHREDGLQRRHLHLVDAHGARDRVARAAARRGRRARARCPACGPPSSLSPENVTRSAPSASASATRRLVRRACPGSRSSSPEPTS